MIAIENSNTERNRIDYLKAFASILVVLHHSLEYYNSVAANAGGVIGYVTILCHSVNVSLFVLIAGYLCHEQPIKNFYIKKLKRIFIPFVTFSVLKLLYSLFISNEFSHGSTMGEQLYNCFLIGNQYWFAYAMLLIFMIAPVIWKLPKDKPKNWIIWLFIILVMLSVYDILELGFLPDIFQFSNGIHYLWFFLVGYMIKSVTINQKHCMDYVKTRYLFICVLTLIATTIYAIMYFAYGINFDQFPVRPILGLILARCLFLLSCYMPKDLRLLLLISKYSLQVMFFDAFYRIVLIKLFTILGILGIGTVLLSCVLNIALTVLSCMLIEKMRYARVLFGI